MKSRRTYLPILCPLLLLVTGPLGCLLVGFVAGAVVGGLNVSNSTGGLAIDVAYLLVGEEWAVGSGMAY
jgi:hypothetical protein